MSHRVELEFNGGSMYAKLICPEGGCSPAGTCGFCGRDLHDEETKPCYDCSDAETWRNECWVKTWFDNSTPDELLSGKVEFAIDAEWEFDHPVVHISDGSAQADKATR